MNAFRLDLLAYGPVRRLVQRPALGIALQGASLAAAAALVAAGLGIGAGVPAAELLTLRKTNLATLVVWGLWWPALIVAALAFGRAWCAACPMELLNRAGDALARRVGLPRARLGATVRAGWLIVVLYVVLQLLVAGFSIHRVPHFTALVLLALAATALGTGLLFRDPRSFCRGFCPAGALLSVYGRHAPLRLQPRDPGVCAACATRDCLHDPSAPAGSRRGCPSLLRPFEPSPGEPCVLCFECVRACPRENLGFGVAARNDAASLPPGTSLPPAASLPAAWPRPASRPPLLRPSDAAFVMVALGFVAHETVGEVPWLEAAFHAAPQRAAALAGSGGGFGWWEATWFLAVFPALVWAGVALVARLVARVDAPRPGAGRAGWRDLLTSAATAAAPAVAVAHVAKALAKSASWAGYLPLALSDPRGMRSAAALAAGTLPGPARLLELRWVGALVLLLLAGFAVFTWRSRVPARLPVPAAAWAASAVTVLLFAAVLAAWVVPA